MRYLIWSFDYIHASAGPKVLHRLCHELNAAGQEAYVSHPVTNPEWDTPHHDGPLTGDWTAIYPEVVSGNPLGAPHVVRWLLNAPGRLGGDLEYAPEERVYTYSRLYHPTAPMLKLQAIETDIYTDRGLPRDGAVYYVGKGHMTPGFALPGVVPIEPALRADREALAEALNRATYMFTFDSVTGMSDIARLCGCRVVLIPDGLYERAEYEQSEDMTGMGWNEIPPPFDTAAFRAEHLAQHDVFRDQLAGFIRQTDLALAS